MADVLYLKGSNLPGQGKTRLGDCIKSQRVWMIMKLKHLEDKFEIRFIDEKTKQKDPEFKQLDATMTPVLRHREIEYQDADEISYHLEKHFPDPPLDTRDVEANALGSQATPMSSLNGWIKNKNAKKEEFLIEKFHRTLGEIDHTLEKKFAEFGGPFICGPDPKFPDCILLPKLYHAKLAALYTKGYDFTKSGGPGGWPKFENIAKYLEAAEKNPVFRETCPSEEEIRDKWRAHRK